MKPIRVPALLAGPAVVLALAGSPATDARSGTAPAGSTLNVFAAASLSDAFTQMARWLEQRRTGLRVRLNVAGSQQLATQIEQGAGADVFASADERWMGYARDHRLLAGEPIVFARNRLVVIVPRANPARIARLQDLARPGLKLVLAAEAVPAGRYSRALLGNLARDPAFGADFADRALRNLVSDEENVKSVVGKIVLGEADAGVVYRSDVTPAVARDVRVLEVPERANVTASYPIAIVRNARDPVAARAFVDLVRSPEGQRILESAGFLPAPATGP